VRLQNAGQVPGHRFCGKGLLAILISQTDVNEVINLVLHDNCESACTFDPVSAPIRLVND
jgi:hypothetical protein